MNSVKLFSGLTITPVAATPSAVAMPAGLVIAPGTYVFNGGNYQFTADGMAQFWDSTGGQYIRKIVWSGDVDAFMSAVAWLTLNGTGEEALTPAAKTNLASTQSLRMLCGDTAEWALALCSSLGIQARMVRALTAGTPNGFFEGHVMVEAKVGGEWRLYDLSHNQSYLSSAGKSLRAVVPLLETTQVIQIADDMPCAVEPIAQGAFNPLAMYMLHMGNGAEMQSVIRSVLQIPGIDHSDGNTYFYMPPGTELRQSWVTGLQASFKVITKAAWDTMFYS